MSGVPYFFDKVMRGLVEHGLADQPDSLSKMLGGRLRACTSGGAALPDHVAEFFTRRGIPLTQGYGLTETSPVMTLDTQEDQTIGSVGRPLPGVEVRIADDGEVLTRGPNLMLGYWNKPQATAEAIRDGWFHTGDLGALDDNGRLRITGRKKELIVTAAGKNVAPALLEGLLCEDPLIAQAMVLGDGRNFLAALIVPNASALDAELKRRQIEVESPAAALEHPAVRALYEECLHRRLAGLSHCEQIGQFALIPQPLTLEAAELTPTLKLRRGVVAARYADVIRRMYGE
jgi:long-chain acyl-CoA synthetase